MTWLTFSIFLDHAAEFPALQRDIRSISIQNNSNIRFGKKPEGMLMTRYKYNRNTNINTNTNKAPTIYVEVNQ